MTTIIKKYLINIVSSALIILVLAIFVSGSAYAGGGHSHGGDHHEDGHDDHSDEPALVYTHYTDSTELFVEFPPLVVNQPSTFIVHFTRLDDFKPLTNGILNIHLKQNNKTVARFRVKAPARTGIFLPDVTAKKTGKFQLVLEIEDGELHAIHNLGEVTVFPNEDAVVIEQDEVEGEINYLKEQQWTNPFALVQSKSHPIRSSVPGFGTVTAPNDGFAIVRASSDGYFNSDLVLNAGNHVTQGQSLGVLIPRLGDGADIGNLLVNQEKARAQKQLSEADVKRLQALFDQGAIPEKRLLEAKQKLEIARVELQTSQSRLKQHTGKTSKAGIRLVSPIVGELVEVSVRPGSFVRTGDALFTIADPKRRWLDIHIPEKYGNSINEVSGIWLQDTEEIRVLDALNDAQVIKVSKHVNPITRTMNIAIQYPSKSGPSLLGARHPVNVYVGEPEVKLVVPASAIIDDAGQSVIYVQTAGETFARRSVLLGVQDGPWVEILQGVEPGEWIVSQGAYYVKLASTGDDAIGHGHAH